MLQNGHHGSGESAAVEIEMPPKDVGPVAAGSIDIQLKKGGETETLDDIKIIDEEEIDAVIQKETEKNANPVRKFARFLHKHKSLLLSHAALLLFVFASMLILSNLELDNERMNP